MAAKENQISQKHGRILFALKLDAGDEVGRNRHVNKRVELKLRV